MMLSCAAAGFALDKVVTASSVAVTASNAFVASGLCGKTIVRNLSYRINTNLESKIKIICLLCKSVWIPVIFRFVAEAHKGK